MQGSKPCALPLGDTPIIVDSLIIHEFINSIHPCNVLRILQCFFIDVNFRKQINYKN
ncbi:TPA: hypothetical protein JBK46_04175 [Legionella pneumophila]|uniref:Uncharacterized protein n=1 Tax=Legionella pneumophila subsp. pneumophila TaxID=91891 RepID=A0A3A6W496_LEGPN|nr:hypothetical protein C3929_03135 [Legionella pneumophila]RJY26389.1 hypothetical protein D1H99_13400 [Legionella pneumophila subsp. pneumophila]PQM72813.1 hypothetical protein C3926_03085 [Legionella pneumophila]PYB45508.1 hypothetical protein DM454_04835 [Legionella pneumophila]PYB47599.1 hypothetical protein DM453_06995 [Legionella pneumophila]